jgi:hypothetical protein
MATVLIFVRELVDERRSQKDRKCTYNVKLWSVRVTIVTVKRNNEFCVFPYYLLN